MPSYYQFIHMELSLLLITAKVVNKLALLAQVARLSFMSSCVQWCSEVYYSGYIVMIPSQPRTHPSQTSQKLNTFCFNSVKTLVLSRDSYR